MRSKIRARTTRQKTLSKDIILYVFEKRLTSTGNHFKKGEEKIRACWGHAGIASAKKLGKGFSPAEGRKGGVREPFLAASRKEAGRR